MAPKRASKSSAPPPAASSEETDSRSRSEESEDEETHAVTCTPASKNPPAPPAQKDEESETSEEEEEEEPTRAAPPYVPKNPPPPPRQSEKSDTSDEEEEEDEEFTRAVPPSVPENPPPPPRQSEKSDTSDEEEEEEGEEESESDEEAPPTKPAPKQEAEGLKPPTSGEAKKPAAPFHRVWSTDDEVRILEALAAHRREHGALPQPNALVATLAGSLDNSAYGSKELQGKVKSLKHRYVIAAKKSELPSKEHDRRLFDLSKIVWGGDKTAAPVAAAKAKANGHELRAFSEMCDLYPYLAEEVKELEVAHPGMFKREFGKMDDDKARALDVKIKKQRVVQMKVELRRGDLAKEVTKTLMELVD